MCVIRENVDMWLFSPLWPVHVVSVILSIYLLLQLWLHLPCALRDVPSMFLELFPQFLADLADFSRFNEELHEHDGI